MIVDAEDGSAIRSKIPTAAPASQRKVLRFVLMSAFACSWRDIPPGPSLLLLNPP